MPQVILYVDGGCSGNWQRDKEKRVMRSAVTDCSGKILVDRKIIGGSNNLAELYAVKYALEWCAENGVEDVHIRTDSRNNLAWVFGRRVGKHINDRESVLQLKKLINVLGSIVRFSMSWVPREENPAGHYLERCYLEGTNLSLPFKENLPEINGACG